MVEHFRNKSPKKDFENLLLKEEKPIMLKWMFEKLCDKIDWPQRPADFFFRNDTNRLTCNLLEIQEGIYYQIYPYAKGAKVATFYTDEIKKDHKEAKQIIFLLEHFGVKHAVNEIVAHPEELYRNKFKPML